MRVRTFEIALACGMAFFTYAAARASAQAAKPKPQTQARGTSDGTAKATSSENDAGEKVFQTHCSRCHNAPEDLSPRVVRAVVRQMRVRAVLTEDDERVLVKFLAP